MGERRTSNNKHEERRDSLGPPKGSTNSMMGHGQRKRGTIVVSDPSLDVGVSPRSSLKGQSALNASARQSVVAAHRKKSVAASPRAAAVVTMKKVPSSSKMKTPSPKSLPLTTFQQVGNTVEEVVVVDEGEELLLRECARLTEMYNQYIGGIRSLADVMKILDSVGQHVSEKECMEYCQKVGYQAGRTMTLNEFLEVIRLQKTRYCDSIVDDTTEAFLAVSRGTDSIAADDLRILVKDFKLTVDIERLLEEADEDGSGVIEFDEFQAMLKAVAGAGDDDLLDTPRQGLSDFFRSSFIRNRRTSSFTVKKTGLTRRTSMAGRRSSMIQSPETMGERKRRQSMLEVTKEEDFDPFQFRKSLAVDPEEVEAAFTPEDWYQRQKQLRQREDERRRSKSALPFIDPLPQIAKYKARKQEMLSNPRRPWGVRHSDEALASSRLPELQRKRLSPISEPLRHHGARGVASSLSPAWRVAYNEFIHRPKE